MRFEYRRVKSLQEVLEILAPEDEKVQILAGGTDIMVDIQDGLISPRILIDISDLEELKKIEKKDGHIEIGAAVTYAKIICSSLLKNKAPPLLQASSRVGSPQIRARGTLGGSVVTGSPAGDVIPPLYVLDAVLILKSMEGERKIPVSRFFTGVKKTSILADELLYKIVFPIQTDSNKGFFYKLGQRKALACSKISVAAWMGLEGRKITTIRLALGAVAPTVIRALKTESALKGQTLNEGIIVHAAQSIQAESRAICDIRSTAEYRNEMTGVLLTRGFERILDET